MDTTTVRDLFSIAEDHGAEWYDANRAMISRTTPALGFEAFTDREHVKAYFFYLWRINAANSRAILACVRPSVRPMR